jgi:hypothetical protein
MVDADEPNTEPVDQGRDDFCAAMEMATCDLIEVATAYLRRLRADEAWDAAYEAGDEAAQDAAQEAMFNADMDARNALGLLDDVCADCAAKREAEPKVPDGFRAVLD